MDILQITIPNENLNESCNNLIKITQTFVPEDLIDNISALIQVMAWGQISEKPLSEPVMTTIHDAIWHLSVTTLKNRVYFFF